MLNLAVRTVTTGLERVNIINCLLSLLMYSKITKHHVNYPKVRFAKFLLFGGGGGSGGLKLKPQYCGTWWYINMQHLFRGTPKFTCRGEVQTVMHKQMCISLYCVLHVAFHCVKIQSRLLSSFSLHSSIFCNSETSVSSVNIIRMGCI
jgi:hypothetical protein